MRTALLDGDIFAHESATRGERKFDWDGGDPAVEVDGDLAEANLVTRIETVKEACNADAVVVALSCPTRRYFRHELWPEYKGHRKGEPPVLLSHLKTWLRDNSKSYWKPGLEADDVLGILATSNVIKGEKIVVSADKDLLQIPGLHLNPRKLDEGIREVSWIQGEAWHLQQTLMGDATDNYPGCPRIPGRRGYGPKTAEKLVWGEINSVMQDGGHESEALSRAWIAVEQAYALGGWATEQMLVQARVARILRAENWDFKKKEILPWEIPC